MGVAVLSPVPGTDVRDLSASGVCTGASRVLASVARPKP